MRFHYLNKAVEGIRERVNKGEREREKRARKTVSSNRKLGSTI